MSCHLNSNDLHRIFEKLDRNNDGHVSLDELSWLLHRTGAVNADVSELESLVGKTSLDLIDFFLFYESVVVPNLEETNTTSEEREKEEDIIKDSDDDDVILVKAFEVYDLNGDGYISCEELQSVLTRLGLWDERRDCRRMINVYDTNSDGLLDFEEFKNMMLFGTSS